MNEHTNVIHQCDGDDSQVANLEELGWPKEVMARLDRHSELLMEVKTRLDREIQARLEAIIDRQDKANGRTGKAESNIELILAWRERMMSEHTVLQSNQRDGLQRLSKMEAAEAVRLASARTSRSWVEEIKWWLLALILLGTLLATAGHKIF